MSDFEKQIIAELSKEYVTKTFDFKNNSPEDLIKYYLEVSEKMSKVIEDKNVELSEECIKILEKINF